MFLQPAVKSRRENENERRARDAESQDVDRLEHGFPERREATEQIDRRNHYDEPEVDRGRKACARQIALEVYVPKLLLKRVPKPEARDRGAHVLIERSGFPGLSSRARNLH